MTQQLLSEWRVGLMMGVLAVSGLGSAMWVDHARAVEDTVGSNRDATILPGHGAERLPGTPAKVPARISELLATAEQQITDGRMWSPPDDNAMGTFRSIIAALPNASTADLQTMWGIPSRFAARVRAAEAAGRHEEAQRFLTWVQAFAAAPGAATESPSVEVPAETSGLPGTMGGDAGGRNAGGGIVASQPAALAPTPPALPPPMPNPVGLQAAVGPVGPPLSSDMVALLLQRGEAMERVGDISAARLLYGRAAMAGSAPAATAMGKMFDPLFLAEIGVRGIAPDPDLAASWYHKAITLGDRGAESRLQELGRERIAMGSHLPSLPDALPIVGLSRAPSIPIKRNVARAVDEHCRAILPKTQLAEEPSHADRTYLRQGCQRG